MITCCELALWIVLGAFTVILSLLAMFFNYNLKLDARTVKLEKKNGHERSQLAEQVEEIKKLNEKIKKLEEKYDLPNLPEKKNPS